MDWGEVAARLAAARSYWLHSHGSGRWAARRTGLGGGRRQAALYLYTERSTVKARNLARRPTRGDPPAGSGELPDRARLAGRPRPAPGPSGGRRCLDAAYPDPADRAYLPSADPAFDVLYALRPSRARAWRLADWDGSQATWRVEG